jgi:drug/metabolite transporter (DMT)-like permease
MNLLPTRIHGIVDYVVGVALIAAPWIFQFNDVDSAKWVAIGVGLSIIVYSLFTDYELGAVRAIPMPGHLLLDVGGGAFLAASPWLFGFADDGTNVWLPHVVVGLADIGIAAFTSRRPGDRSRGAVERDDLRVDREDVRRRAA